MRTNHEPRKIATAAALALTMAADHAALREHLAAHGDEYERRDDPDAQQRGDSMAAKLDAIAEGLQEFQRRMNARIERIENRGHRPGAGTGAGNDPEAEQRARSIFLDNVDRGELRVLRHDSDFDRHYAQRTEVRGLEAVESSGRGITVAQWMRGVAGMETSPEVRATLQTGTNSAGGFAVPDILMPQILRAMVPDSTLMLSGAGIVDMSGVGDGAKTYTQAAINALPTPGWRAELGGVAQSEPTFRAVVAVPRSLAFILRVSRELLADADNMSQSLVTAIGQALALEYDRVGLRGSGTAPEPRGILNTTDVASVTQGANGATVTNYAPILSAMLAIRKNNGPTPTGWITSPDAAFKYAGLADSTGQPLQAPEKVRMLAQRDTTQIPINLTVGTSTDCTEQYVGDFTNLYYLMRENVSMQILRELYAGTGEVAFLVHARLDVFIPYPKAFAVVRGTRVG
jgi:HK97 family phage major capsid protein